MGESVTTVPIILPFHPETASATIEIDGVTYRVPLIDSDGHLQVDVISAALATDAATATNQATMITALQLIDDLRNALDAVQTDRLNVNVYRDGASEVKSVLKTSVDPSTGRATAVTPTSGKKIRVVSCLTIFSSVTASFVEVYFGTGGSISTNPGKEIMFPRMGGPEVLNVFAAWPDGGGPVGGVDEVLSLRTNVNITTNAHIIVLYREE